MQSPWEITGDDGRRQILKRECYLFDFALNRALRQISDYSCRLNIAERNPEKKIEDIIRFLPVLAYDGSSMRPLNAADILDYAMTNTTATLLAKRWESALLVNVDNDTLSRLLANKEAMDALMRIEGFRSLNTDIETIINKSEAVKNAKKEKDKLTSKEKKKLSDEEKEYKSRRKEIQEKLIKFATRIPIFIYLSDFREHCLKDVITQLQPELFRRVTGLTVKDFELLVSLNVFNESLMNDAVYKFKRYEDSSLSYTGMDAHEGVSDGDVGLFSTVISRGEYDAMNAQLTGSFIAPAPGEDDMPADGYYVGNDEADESDAPETDSPRDAQPEPPGAERAAKPSSPRASTGAKPAGAAPPETGKQAPQRMDSASVWTSKPAQTPDMNRGGTTQPVYGDASPKREPERRAQPATASAPRIAVGDIVRHRSFGNGAVTHMEGAAIWVMLGGVERRFQYPTAFTQGFLTKS